MPLATPPSVWRASGETPELPPSPDQLLLKASDAFRVCPARPGTGPRRLAGE